MQYKIPQVGGIVQMWLNEEKSNETCKMCTNANSTETNFTKSP